MINIGALQEWADEITAEVNVLNEFMRSTIAVLEDQELRLEALEKPAEPPKGVWVVYGYDVGPFVTGFYSSSEAAVAAQGQSGLYVKFFEYGEFHP